MERTGQCHCGALRVITTGEPDRVYLCHCQACQRRTGTAFHFGASFPKEQVRLDGERTVYERDADSGYRIRFHFCPNCGTTLYWKGDRSASPPASTLFVHGRGRGRLTGQSVQAQPSLVLPQRGCGGDDHIQDRSEVVGRYARLIRNHAIQE